MLAGWKHEGKNGTEIQTCDFLHNALTQLRELARNALQRATTRQMANTICLVWLRRWCLAPWKNQSFLFRLSTQLSLEGFFFCKVFSGQMQLQKMQVSKKIPEPTTFFWAKALGLLWSVPLTITLITRTLCPDDGRWLGVAWAFTMKRVAVGHFVQFHRRKQSTKAPNISRSWWGACTGGLPR